MSDILNRSSASASFVRLDPDAILALLAEQQLKRWWVAEFTGVHKTTLRRWLTGAIDRVRRENATALASLLEVELETIQLDPHSYENPI